MTRFRAFLLMLGLLFVAFVAVEYFRPQPTDWTPTYSNRDKIPYGTYVLFDQLPTLFPRQPVASVRLPIANQLLPTLGTDVNPDSVLTAPLALRPDSATYLFVNTSFSCSRLDRDALLRYLARGNHALIAAEQPDDALLDSLRLEVTPALSLDSLLAYRARRQPGQQRATTLLTLVRPPQGAAATVRLPTDDAAWYLRAKPGSRARVLAYAPGRRPVLVRVPVGRGSLLLSTTPAAFSNRHLLRPATAGLGLATLSYLPAGRPVFWDEYQKQGPLGEQSLLRVLNQHEALRWAWYVSLVGMLLFVLVEARRRQRIIPVLKPLPNTSLLFTRTVASLYRQGTNHAPIAEQKISLFLDHLRQQLHEPALDLNDSSLRERLAQKAGVPRPQVDQLIGLIHRVQTAPQVNEADLLRLSRTLDDFRKALY